MVRLICFTLILFYCVVIQADAQKSAKNPKPAPTPPAAPQVKTSAPMAPFKTTLVYGELLAKKIEAQAELQVLLEDYNEQAPQVRDMQLRVKWLELALKKLETMPADALTSLTPAMSIMLARRIEAEAELFILREIYTEEFPSVKKAKTRLSVLESELKKALL